MKNPIIKLPNIPYALILKMDKAWLPFCSQWQIPMPLFGFKDIEKKQGMGCYIKLRTEDIDPNKFGIFLPCIKRAWFYFFGGIDWPAPQSPYLHASLNIRYEVLDGDENGFNYVIDGSSSIYYGVVEEKWMTLKEVAKAMDPACKTCKPKKTLSAYYKTLFAHENP
jgi:hypothetical protein